MTEFRVDELAYVRVQVPDIARGSTFLRDFGLLEVDAPSQDDGRRFFRSSDDTPFCYELVEGEQRFLGFGFNVSDRMVLERAGQSGDAPVQTVEGPGGGEFVRLVEPNGYAIDLVHGRGTVAPIELKRQLLNTGAQPFQRKELFRHRREDIVPVLRLAHVVLGSPKVAETVGWFQDTLGMLISDEVVAGPDEQLTGAFMRLDAGDRLVDHHTVFVVRSPEAGLHHISFEVHDVDALLAEHNRLKSLALYDHVWGIGRHTLGSQIFDYWMDPFGYLHEHWADTDRLNADTPPNRWDVRQGMVTQWGDPTPERVRHAARP